MFEKKKERDVAPTRGQFPCPAFGPHGASLSAAWLCFGVFSRVLFSSFLFFLLSPFFLWGFSIQNALSLQHCQSGHLRTCAQPRDQVPEEEEEEGKKKFGARFITLIMNLIWSRRCESQTSLPFFGSLDWGKRGGTLQKMSELFSSRCCFTNTWANFVIEMLPEQLSPHKAALSQEMRQKSAQTEENSC